MFGGRLLKHHGDVDFISGARLSLSKQLYDALPATDVPRGYHLKDQHATALQQVRRRKSQVHLRAGALRKSVACQRL